MTNNTRPLRAQAHDFFAAMLNAKRVPPLYAVLMHEALHISPRPLGPPEGLICRSNGTLAARNRWPKSVQERAKKYPGYQPGHDMRERMKYRNTPDENAPLAEFVWKRLDHARAIWSEEIDAKRTGLQFEEWLPQLVSFRTFSAPLWPLGHRPDDNWALSFQFLRLACGLSRFVPTRSAA